MGLLFGVEPQTSGGGSKEGETTCTRHSNHATTRRNGASWPTLRRAARSVPSSPVSAPQRPKRHQSQGCHCLIPNLRSRSWPGRSGHLRAGREPQAGPHVAAGSFKFCWLAVYLVARSKMKKKNYLQQPESVTCLLMGDTASCHQNTCALSTVGSASCPRV